MQSSIDISLDPFSLKRPANLGMQETEKARWDEQRKTMQQDTQAKAQLAQYEDELARKRNDAEHQKNRERNQELVIMQEESNRKQQSEKRRIQEQIEGERRATEKYKVTFLQAEMIRCRPLIAFKVTVLYMLVACSLVGVTTLMQFSEQSTGLFMN